MSLALQVPFLAIGGLMLVDEAAFHVRRGLPRWERIGHPVDTACFVAALAFAALAPQAPWTFGAYCALATLSCLIVTKDEWVHARLCGGAEQFVHALLFLLHPLALVAAWRLRQAGEPPWLALAAACAFMGWQVVYWNVVRKDA